jgi:phage terminase small subunit
MSVSGRKPVPGGEIEKRAQKHGPTGDVVAMEAPADLSPEAAELWEIAISDLIALKMFRVSDAPMLAEFCSCLAMTRSFRRELDSLGVELRVVNEYLLGVARKNAKTTLTAALALTLLVARRRARRERRHRRGKARPGAPPLQAPRRDGAPVARYRGVRLRTSSRSSATGSTSRRWTPRSSRSPPTRRTSKG